MTSAASIALASLAFMASDPALPDDTLLSETLRTYVEARVKEADEVSPQRKETLDRLATFVSQRTKAGEPARLIFICTHNSRRSHLAQIWAETAANCYRVPRVETFSGGTEATAFNPRAVAALARAGFLISREGERSNPQYSVRRRADAPAMLCFSKVYDQSPNPTKDFCAVMTCSQADEACPLVAGATLRVALPYDDPKVSDGTPEEPRVYDARCAQIAREMLYLFSQVAQK